MRISDWSSDVCSSDLIGRAAADRRVDLVPADRQIVLVEPETMRQPQEILIGDGGAEIGRASCTERVCQCVSISVVAGSLKNKREKPYTHTTPEQITITLSDFQPLTTSFELKLD